MYFKVKAKCGHVGRNNYIEKFFYVVAGSGKEAAYSVRFLPRVKHDRKDAILSVEKISKEEYELGVKSFKTDMYFHVSNSTNQRLVGAVNPQEIKREPEHNKYGKKRNVDFLIKRIKIIENQCREMLSEVCYG